MLESLFYFAVISIVVSEGGLLPTANNCPPGSIAVGIRGRVECLRMRDLIENLDKYYDADYYEDYKEDNSKELDLNGEVPNDVEMVDNQDNTKEKDEYDNSDVELIEDIDTEKKDDDKVYYENIESTAADVNHEKGVKETGQVNLKKGFRKTKVDHNDTIY